MNNQARASAPFRARTSALGRASTPVRPSIPARSLTPVRPSIPARPLTPVRPSIPARPLTPVRPSIPVLAATTVRTSTPIRTATPVRTSTPIRAATPVRTSTPIRAATPVRTSTPVPAATLVRTSAPIRFLTPVSASTAVQTPTLVQAPNPLQYKIPAHTPTPVSTSTPTQSPASDLESFPGSALPLDPPPKPAPESTLSLNKDPMPTLAVMHVPSVSNGFRSTQVSFPTLTPPDTDLLGSTPRADPEAIKLTGSTAGPITTSILGTFPLTTSLPISADTVASTSEYFQVENKIVIRVIYCLSSPPTFPPQEEDIATQTTGEFEVFVDGKLIHSKKKGDGFVDEARLQKIVNIINEEIKKR
ncbi:selenoprotein V [Rhynchonycteris naso]